MLPAPKGVAKIDVTFAIDVNGIVNITATDPVMKKTTSGINICLSLSLMMLILLLQYNCKHLED